MLLVLYYHYYGATSVDTFCFTKIWFIYAIFDILGYMNIVRLQATLFIPYKLYMVNNCNLKNKSKEIMKFYIITIDIDLYE